MAGASRVRLGSVGEPRGEAAGRGPERNYNGRPQGTDCVRMVHVLRRVRNLEAKATRGAVPDPRKLIALFTEAIHLRNRHQKGEVSAAPLRPARRSSTSD